MKIAVIFWGITRSLKYTHSTIKENIFNVFDDNNIDYDTFFYTYSINEPYINVRAKEKVDEFDNKQHEYINFDNFNMIPQEIVKKELNVDNYKSKRDPFENNYSSVENSVLTFYSKKKSFEMVKKSGKKYTHFLFIRPDVNYLNKIDIQWFKDCDNNSIMIPIFHQFHFKFNDRMALCSNFEIAKAYGECFDGFLNFSKEYPAHSETFVRHYLVTKITNLNIISIPFYFNRVRYDGTILNDCDDFIPK